MRRVGFPLVALVLATVLALGLLEGGLSLAGNRGWMDVSRPQRSAGSDFWDGAHPDFGVWHKPDASLRHTTACFDVQYRTNSAGARDVERARRAGVPRVVVLGDSFLEGWGVANGKRVSDLLTAATGIEHLNFAMAHFSPYQGALAYAGLASQWDHTAVIASLLPTNDFFDLDLELGRAAPGYEYRYRPYLVESANGSGAEGAGAEGGDASWRRFDYREGALVRWLRRNTWTWNALSARLARPAPAAESARAPGASGASGPPDAPVRSWFWDYDERQYRILEAALERLLDAAGDHPVALVLIPTLQDLHRYGQSGPDPLSSRLREFARGRRLSIVNLLPTMHGHSHPWDRYYFLSCDDYHWNEYGNAVAAHYVLQELRDEFYGRMP